MTTLFDDPAGQLWAPPSAGATTLDPVEKPAVEGAGPVAPQPPPPSRGNRQLPSYTELAKRFHRPQLRGNTRLIVVLTVCALIGFFLVFEVFLSGLQESREQGILYDQLRQNLAAEVAPLGGAIQPGTPDALLNAPGAGLHNEVVVEGTSSSDLRKGPGHLADTVLPGQPGTSYIFGRGATFGGPFGSIGKLTIGSKITVTTQQGVFTYRVDHVRRPGDPNPGEHVTSALELVSSEGTGLRSLWAPDHAVYVDASLVKGQPQPTSPGQPSKVPGSQLAMGVDTSQLVPLVLWLQALLLVVGAGAWSWRKWGRWQTAIAAAPLLLAALWGVSGAAAVLLPNLV